MALRRPDSSVVGESGVVRVTAPAATQTSSELLGALCDVAGRLDSFDDLTEETSLRGLLTKQAELVELVKYTVAQLRALEQLNSGDDELELDFDADPPTVGGLRIVVPALPPLADVCFAGVLELNRALAELDRASTLEDVLIALETALRKLRRAIRAAVDSAQESGVSVLRAGEHFRQRGGVDLTATLAVRRLYAEFRRGLRRPQDESAAAVLTALRYAAGALATLISSKAYAFARVADRALLRRLHQRLFAWARAGKPSDRGLELLDDIWTSADLLRSINRRQELRSHDTALVQRLCAGPASDAAPWLEQLSRLHGLDDQLDALIDRSTQALGQPLLDEILVRLCHLR